MQTDAGVAVAVGGQGALLEAEVGGVVAVEGRAGRTLPDAGACARVSISRNCCSADSYVGTGGGAGARVVVGEVGLVDLAEIGAVAGNWVSEEGGRAVLHAQPRGVQREPPGDAAGWHAHPRRVYELPVETGNGGTLHHAALRRSVGELRDVGVALGHAQAEMGVRVGAGRAVRDAGAGCVFAEGAWGTGGVAGLGGVVAVEG